MFVAPSFPFRQLAVFADLLSILDLEVEETLWAKVSDTGAMQEIVEVFFFTLAELV